VKNKTALVGVCAYAAAFAVCVPVLAPVVASAKDGKVLVGVSMNRQAERRWAIDVAAMQLHQCPEVSDFRVPNIRGLIAAPYSEILPPRYFVCMTESGSLPRQFSDAR
jgi:hypothetical protein